MRRKTRLARLARNERGNVLAMAAATLPMLLGAAGFGIDTMQIAVMKRQMQRAADAGALAGAYALAQSASVDRAVGNDLVKNRHPLLSEPQSVLVGPRLGFDRTVSVQLVSRPRLPFMSLFTKGPATIGGEATAALIDEGKFCVLSLYGGTDSGVVVGGNARVDLGCGIATNARGANAISATGSTYVNASPLMAVGGLSGGGNFAGEVKLQPYSSMQKDPFAGIGDPPAQSCSKTVTVAPSEVATLEPGCYGSLDIKGTATLAPGTYYINGGDLAFGSQAHVTGSGVTFVMTGPGGNAGDLRMNGQAHVDLTAAATGDYAGLLFYRDRRAGNIEIKVNGGATSKMVGAFYAPSSDITFNGAAGLQVRCFQMVGQIIKLQGDATISNSCPDFGNAPDFALQFVRIIR